MIDPANMEIGSFRLVFDLGTTDRWFWDIFPIFWLPAIGLVLVAIPQRLLDRIPGFRPKGAHGKLISILFFTLTAAVTAAITFDHHSQAMNLRKLEQDGVLTLTEGCLRGFHRMPSEGHDYEQIEVKDLLFSYSDFDASTPAFNQTESHGGPIHADSAVRIWHSGNDIVKLAVSDHACPSAPDLPQ